MIEIPIGDIVIGDRHRKDQGDIEGLAKSIEALGLLQPIGITKRNVLVFGERRLRAFQQLGRRTIPCHLVDVPRIVDGEHAENEIRKSFTNDEKHAIALAVVEEIKARGERRGRPKKANDSDEKIVQPVVQFIREATDAPEPGEPDNDERRKTVEVAAAKVGWSRETLRKATEVKAAVEADPEKNGDLLDKLNKSVKGAWGELQKRKDREKVNDRVLIAGKFRALVIDPPWHYDSGRPSRADTLYATMKVKEIARLPVHEWADDADCHLWLWTTNFHLPHAVKLIETWGFTYKSILTWVKPKIGAGPAYFRNTTEHCLFAVRGKIGIEARDIASHFNADVGEHSEKPEAFYDIVRRASLQPFGEAFQRTQRQDFTDLIPIKQMIMEAAE